jgi:hypothetical protein
METNEELLHIMNILNTTDKDIKVFNKKYKTILSTYNKLISKLKKKDTELNLVSLHNRKIAYMLYDNKTKCYKKLGNTEDTVVYFNEAKDFIEYIKNKQK